MHDCRKKRVVAWVHEGITLLDGPTGTELEQRGFQTRLPLWTATAAVDVPDMLLAIHTDYVAAGADVLTACTFRTTKHTLSKAGLGAEATYLTKRAVEIASNAASSTSRSVLIAGSIAPLEDCYAPNLTPDDEVLHREHEAHVKNLMDAGVDLLLVESMPTQREAICAARAAISTKLPVAVSFLAGRGGKLFDGTPIEDGLSQLLELPIDLVAINCCSLAACRESLPMLARSGCCFGAYANAGEPDGSFGQRPTPLSLEEYGRAMATWLDIGAVLIGGCCGTGPEHIALAKDIVQDRARSIKQTS